VEEGRAVVEGEVLELLGGDAVGEEVGDVERRGDVADVPDSGLLHVLYTLRLVRLRLPS
jgi:hypothetical protein